MLWSSTHHFLLDNWMQLETYSNMSNFVADPKLLKLKAIQGRHNFVGFNFNGKPVSFKWLSLPMFDNFWKENRVQGSGG